jgi:muconolactone D-isomerase
MEFLVRTRLTRPAWATESEEAHRAAAERAVVGDLIDAGVMKRLWRVPGQWGSWVLFECADPTALHDSLSSLPLYPWMQIDVHPLAKHPFDAS